MSPRGGTALAGTCAALRALPANAGPLPSGSSCLPPPTTNAPPPIPAPCRTLMCRATGTTPELLADRELAALIAIDWEVQAVLRQGGLAL